MDITEPKLCKIMGSSDTITNLTTSITAVALQKGIIAPCNADFNLHSL